MINDTSEKNSIASLILLLLTWGIQIRSVRSFTAELSTWGQNHVCMQTGESTRIFASNRDNDGTKSVAAGALLGGLLGGPFGLLFGAQIGANLGRKYQNDKAQKEEMERLGITPEMLQMAEECGVALNRAMEGVEATKDSLDSLQRLARRLESSSNDLYEKAQKEIVNGNEDEARKLLLERQNVQDKLMKTLLNCKDEKKRYEQMQQNLEALENRAMEIDSLLKRSVGAKALMDSSGDIDMIAMDTFRMETEDPLLRKFKELEKE